MRNFKSKYRFLAISRNGSESPDKLESTTRFKGLKVETYQDKNMSTVGTKGEGFEELNCTHIST